MESEFGINDIKEHSVILTPMLANKPRESPKLPSITELNLPKLEISPPSSPSVTRLQDGSPHARRHSLSSTPVSIREYSTTPPTAKEEMLLEAFAAEMLSLFPSPNTLRRGSLDSSIAAPSPSAWPPKRDVFELLDKSSEELLKRRKEEEAEPKKRTRTKKAKKVKFTCEGPGKCRLCKNGMPYYLHRSMSPGWRETIMAVFEFFPKRVTESSWRKFQHQLALGLPADDPSEENEQSTETKWLYFPDAYDFLEHHWELLCPPQHKNRPMNSSNWKKTLQDTLSHNRTFFISGKDMFGKTGFWRMSEHAVVGNAIPFDPRVAAAMAQQSNNSTAYTSPFQFGMKPPEFQQRVNHPSTMESASNLRV